MKMSTIIKRKVGLNQEAKASARSLFSSLSDTQLRVLVDYMRMKRQGYQSCTPMKMRSQLRRIGRVEVSASETLVLFRGSYGDTCRLPVPNAAFDSRAGRSDWIASLRREVNGYGDLRVERETRELKHLINKYYTTAKELINA